MGIICFRPYKRLSNNELLIRIDKGFERLQENGTSNEIEEYNLNELIKESKHRSLTLKPSQLYAKILFSTYED